MPSSEYLKSPLVTHYLTQLFTTSKLRKARVCSTTSNHSTLTASPSYLLSSVLNGFIPAGRKLPLASLQKTEQTSNQATIKSTQVFSLAASVARKSKSFSPSILLSSLPTNLLTTYSSTALKSALCPSLQTRDPPTNSKLLILRQTHQEFLSQCQSQRSPKSTPFI